MTITEDWYDAGAESFYIAQVQESDPSATTAILASQTYERIYGGALHCATPHDQQLYLLGFISSMVTAHRASSNLWDDELDTNFRLVWVDSLTQKANYRGSDAQYSFGAEKLDWESWVALAEGVLAGTITRDDLRRAPPPIKNRRICVLET